VKLFAIADLHLSFGVKNKDMCIFKGWREHWKKLQENWNRVVGEDDTVVIAGDISWAKTLEETIPDFEFIDKSLNGNKIIIKGNHDYWWETITKMELFVKSNNMSKIRFLRNNSYKVGEFSICGARGFLEDDKMMIREAGRVEASILSAEKDSEIIVFLHYPPIYGYEENRYILEILQKYSIKRVFSGHIHQGTFHNAFIGSKYGIEFDMITADYLKFCPRKIL
jgi:hypothetical protein